MSQSRLIWSGVAAAVAAAVLGACSSGGSTAVTSTPSAPAVATKVAQSTPAAPTVVAGPTDLMATKKAPASMAIDDPAWKDATVTSIRTIKINGSKATAAVSVDSQALYNDTDIWFRFEWPDATANDTAVWQYDGSKWVSVPAISDRFALNWEITKIADFEAKGCQGACHRSDTDPIDTWYMIAPKAGDMIDDWQWTASTYGPMGQGNDLTISGGDLPDPKVLESSIAADKIDTAGGTVSNSAAAPATPGPLKMQDPAKQPTYGPKYLAAADAIPLDMSKIKAGDTIPRTQLAPFTGSRGDIQAKSVWANGKWTLVFHRKLDTGHADDVKFAPGPTQSYPFGLAVFNDLDHFNHTVTEEVFHLRFR